MMDLTVLASEVKEIGEKVRLRRLYFFSGNETVVVTHGLKKKTAEVPHIRIDRALDKKKKFQANPEANSFNWGPDNE